MKVSDLEGALLDVWVARAELAEFQGRKLDTEVVKLVKTKLGDVAFPFRPSLNWAQGGPIIEREEMAVWHNVEDETNDVWHASMSMMGGYESTESGPTLLIAAMRAYVVSKFGNDVPDETPT